MKYYYIYVKIVSFPLTHICSRPNRYHYLNNIFVTVMARNYNNNHIVHIDIRFASAEN